MVGRIKKLYPNYLILIRKKLYPNYLILIRKNNNLYNLDGEIINMNKIKKKYVIIDEFMYEVHKKIT